jgi:hypothetical protein
MSLLRSAPESGTRFYKDAAPTELEITLQPTCLVQVTDGEQASLVAMSFGVLHAQFVK